MAKKLNLIGKVFGELTVIKEGPPKLIGKKYPKNRTTWDCVCSCGKKVNVLTCNLGKHTTSCGCKFKKNKKYNFIDITQNRYGFLTVVERTDKFTKSRGAIWLCKCDCGELVEVATNSLTSGNKITCGIKKNHTKNNLDPRWKRCGDVPLAHLTAIKNNAIKRNLTYNLTPEYLWDLFVKQSKKCVLSGIDLQFTPHRAAIKTKASDTTASLDRIDCRLGYEVGNVRWIHKDLNKMRSIFNDEIFLEYCRKCFLNQYKIDKIDRPTFDEYFINLAFEISLRSDDPNIRHGAVIVSPQNNIVGTGYNGTIRNSDKNKIPYNIRDKKRMWMIHAEENAILNCFVNPIALNGYKMYVTGLPCVNCMQRIINFGIFEIIYAKRNGSITENEETKKMREDIIKMSGIKMREVSLETLWLKKNLYD